MVERDYVAANIKVPILTAKISKIQVKFGVFIKLVHQSRKYHFNKIQNMSMNISKVPGMYDYIFWTDSPLIQSVVGTSFPYSTVIYKVFRLQLQYRIKS